MKLNIFSFGAVMLGWMAPPKVFICVLVTAGADFLSVQATLKGPIIVLCKQSHCNQFRSASV